MLDAPRDPPPTDGFMYELCKAERSLRLLFLLTSAGFGVMAVWLGLALTVPSLEPGTGSYVVAVLGLLFFGSFTAGSAYLTRRCAKRKRLRRAAYQAERADSKRE